MEYLPLCALRVCVCVSRHDQTTSVVPDSDPSHQSMVFCVTGKDKKGERAYIFTDGEALRSLQLSLRRFGGSPSRRQDVMGTAVVSMRPGKKMDHQGVGMGC